MEQPELRRELEFSAEDEPCFVISVAARMLGVHAQTLRYYERLGLVEPSRSRGNIRLYSQANIDKLRHIQKLMSDLGVNLAGVEVVLHMGEHIRRLEAELRATRAELDRLRSTRLPAPRNQS